MASVYLRVWNNNKRTDEVVELILNSDNSVTWATPTDLGVRSQETENNFPLYPYRAETKDPYHVGNVGTQGWQNDWPRLKTKAD